MDWRLQEDNDGSHGHGHPSQKAKKIQLKSLTTALQDDNWVSTLIILHRVQISIQLKVFGVF